MEEVGTVNSQEDATGSVLPTEDWQPAQSSDTPIADSIGVVDPSTVAADPEVPTSDNIPGAVLGTGPWPNQEPVVEGIDDANQDPDFIVNDRVTK